VVPGLACCDERVPAVKLGFRPHEIVDPTMDLPKLDQRLRCLLRALDRRAWRRPPKGTGLKTANTALEHGLVLARGDWKDRRYRLTALGKRTKLTVETMEADALQPG
jgi:hypothetical protein